MKRELWLQGTLGNNTMRESLEVSAHQKKKNLSKRFFNNSNGKNSVKVFIKDSKPQLNTKDEYRSRTLTIKL